MNRTIAAAFRRSLSGFALAFLSAGSGCVATTIEPQRLTIRDTSFSVSNPARVQLTDGGFVAFPLGFRVEEHRLIGKGWRSTRDLRDSVALASVPVDSIADVVAFRTKIDSGQSVAQSVAMAGITLFALFIGVYVLCSATSCMR